VLLTVGFELATFTVSITKMLSRAILYITKPTNYSKFNLLHYYLLLREEMKIHYVKYDWIMILSQIEVPNLSSFSLSNVAKYDLRKVTI
jgi:hypothetical protein